MNDPIPDVVIACQACTPEQSGCYTCGGYKYLLAQHTCECGEKYWGRPGCYSMYEGKQWSSFDGHPFVAKEFKTRCGKPNVMNELLGPFGSPRDPLEGKQCRYGFLRLNGTCCSRCYMEEKKA